ncbi:MAG: flavin-containing monooxygenase [Pseudomonadales bacterium]
MNPDTATFVEQWLASFEASITSANQTEVAALFQSDCHWRDLLALSWNIETTSGLDAVAESLCLCAARLSPYSFHIDLDATAPRITQRGGKKGVLEAVFGFHTQVGACQGVVRFLNEPSAKQPLKAWTMMTSLTELAGFEERIGTARPSGHTYSRNFAGPNWLDRRELAAGYDGRDPEVLVVGGGQAGLAAAARLTQLGVDTLVVDQEERIGDNWRKRYHALVLHNQIHVNHLPYMPFPPNWPVYIPKDKLAGWFEYYAEAMELNVWTNTEFIGGQYNTDEQQWTIELKQTQGVRQMRPRHIVFATSVSSIPKLPDIPTLNQFDGEVIHSSAYSGAEDYKGRRVLIIGTGTSAHDMAQDLYSNGASVSLIQRGSASVINVEPSAQLPYTLYNEDLSFETKDLIATATPYQPFVAAHQGLTKESTRLDKTLLDGLENAGFKIDHEDTDGWQFKYMRRGGGYYFNVGCSELIVEGKVGVIQYDDIESFVADGAQLKNGNTVAADSIILATGFEGSEALVSKLLGKEVADRVGPVWGFGAGQELRNMWVRTAQPGLWFTGGSFAQSRIFSKYLALQIKACQEQMISPLMESKPDSVQ